MKLLLTIIVLSIVAFVGNVRGALVIAAESLRPGPERWGGGSMGLGGLNAIGGFQGDRFYRHFVGQTFIPTESGILRHFKAVIINHSNGTTNDDLEFTLHVLDSGELGPAVDAAIFDDSLITRYTYEEQPYREDYNVAALFGGGIMLEEGKEYAVLIDSRGDSGSHYRIWKPSSQSFDYYPEGRYLENTVDGVEFSRFNSDLFFQVGVNSVPEPSAITVMGLGFAIVIFKRKKCLTL